MHQISKPHQHCSTSLPLVALLLGQIANNVQKPHSSKTMIFGCTRIWAVEVDVECAAPREVTQVSVAKIGVTVESVASSGSILGACCSAN